MTISTADRSNTTRANLQTELLRQAYMALPLALAATLFNGAILCLVMWNNHSHAIVVGWYASLAHICLLRVLDYRYFIRRVLAGRETRSAALRFDILAYLTAALWGTAGYIFFSVVSPVHLAFLSFLLAGMAAGAISSLAVRVRTAQGFLVLALAPFSLQLFMQAESIFLFMGLLVIVFFVYGYSNAKRLGNTLEMNIRLHLQATDDTQRLRQQEELLQETGKIGQIGGWYYQHANQRFSYTPELFAIFDLAPEQPLSRERIVAKYLPQERARVEKLIAVAIVSNKAFDLDVKLEKTNGVTQWLRIASNLLDAGAQTSQDRIGIVQDITERKKIETTLALKQQQLESSIASTNAGNFHYTSAQQVLEIDIKTRKILNIQEESASTVEKFLSHFDNAARNKISNYFSGLDSVCVGPFKFEVVLPCLLKKKPRYIEFNGTVVVDDFKKSYTTSGLIFDVSERREWEAAVKLASQTATEIARVKSNFIANMSHEIRTPLHGIIGMLQSLENTALTTKQQRFTEIATHSAHNLLGIINDILDFSKLEAEKLNIEYKPFDIHACVEHSVALLSSHAAKKGLLLEVNIAQDIPTALLGDPIRIEQILNNYVSNAIKFSEKGFVLIKLSQVGAYQDKIRLRAEVSDTGIGIDAQVQQRLFTPFEQADTSITRRFGGTGLGLSICKQLMELMQGEVGVISEVGKGTTFWFELSLTVTAHALVDTTVIETAPTHYTDYSVLLVEDNPVNQIVASEMLRGSGIGIELAENGQLAVEKRQLGDYTLIFMDMQMPVMDGIEATCKIRQWEIQQHVSPVVIIAMTANAFEEDRDRCLLAGMNDFLSKPFTQQQLHLILTRWLPSPIK
ncbi:MAG: response regulator [Gammaproteobacteria bacterium]|nr:response regulator [Gammaproteobacteria bacterium]